jgi:hypothetical protein
MKAPTSKLQHPEKHQTSTSNSARYRFWSLELEVSLELGAWNLELQSLDVGI